MNIGIVCWWFNRGQATVGRQLRDILDELGHNTFVLARPSGPDEYRPRFISRSDIWKQPSVTNASSFEISTIEYLDWTESNELDIIFFDQNYQFSAVKQLRRLGVKTIGRFVWEQFCASHVCEAVDAYDLIYSLTAAEQQRYYSLGIDSPRVPWGCHPELLKVASRNDSPNTRFFYPGGYLSRRKPTGAVVKAFSKIESEPFRLIVKSQRSILRSDLLPWSPRRRRLMQIMEQLLPMHLPSFDKRIQCLNEDLSQSEYYALFSSCDVCLAPSRWEGLGLHLYEAAAFCMPIITNDAPPMNEWICNGENGLLVQSHQVGITQSGIPVWEPDIEDLKNTIEHMADRDVRESLSNGMKQTRNQLAWGNTLDGFERIISQ